MGAACTFSFKKEKAKQKEISRMGLYKPYLQTKNRSTYFDVLLFFFAGKFFERVLGKTFFKKVFPNASPHPFFVLTFENIGV